MSKAKPPPTQLSREDKLKILKKNKLYTGSTKIVGSKASGAQKRALSKFANDIPLLASGRAKTLDISKVKKSERPQFLRGANKRVIVATEPGERLHVNKKTGEITSIVYSHGKRYRRHFHPTTKKLENLPRGKGIGYQLQFKQWGVADSPIFFDLDEFLKFATEYDPVNGGTFENWEDFVNVLEILK